MWCTSRIHLCLELLCKHYTASTGLMLCRITIHPPVCKKKTPNKTFKHFQKQRFAAITNLRVWTHCEWLIIPVSLASTWCSQLTNKRIWTGKTLFPDTHLIASCDIYSSQRVKYIKIYVFIAAIYGQKAQNNKYSASVFIQNFSLQRNNSYMIELLCTLSININMPFLDASYCTCSHGQTYCKNHRLRACRIREHCWTITVTVL